VCVCVCVCKRVRYGEHKDNVASFRCDITSSAAFGSSLQRIKDHWETQIEKREKSFPIISERLIDPTSVFFYSCSF